MDPTLREQLKSRIIKHSVEFEIEKIITSSYVRQVTESLQVSASDMAYALTSLLEYPHHVDSVETPDVKRQGGKENVNSRNAQTEKALKQISQDQALENLDNCLHDNFWIAYDALDPKAIDLLGKGIHLAKDLQQAIIRVGTSLIDRKEIKLASYFRYVMLDNDYLADVKLFQYPLALQRLGLFVMENFK